MLPVGWLVVAVLAAVLLSMWVTFTLTRLDRLHARVDAARATLDAELVRRAAALQLVAEAPGSRLSVDERAAYEATARAALAGRPLAQRQAVENAVGRALSELGPQSRAGSELHEVAARVQVARRFYNDAVRDTRSLRARRMPRVLRLAGRVELPQFFDIDDSLPQPPRNVPADTPPASPAITAPDVASPSDSPTDLVDNAEDRP